jgi:hypothetical protein
VPGLKENPPEMKRQGGDLRVGERAFRSQILHALNQMVIIQSPKKIVNPHINLMDV